MADAHPPSRGSSSRFEPYLEYKDSDVAWLGAIPAHWDVAALRYRYEQTLGKMLDAKRITGEHLVPYLRNVDVQWDRINLEGLPRMDIRPHEIDRFTVRPGDLLVCEGGEAGRCAIWHGEFHPCGYQKALHRLRPLDRVRDRPRFLYYALLAAVMRGAFDEGQGSTIAHLTGDMLRAHRFPFPSAPEQRAVASFLDRETAKIDALVTKQERLIELLHEKRAAIISQAVTKGLDPTVPMKDSGAQWLGDIPAHWEAKKWRYCCRVAEDGQVAPDRAQYRDRVLIAPDHVEPGTGHIVRLETAHQQGAISGKYLVKPGEIIYSKIRPALNKVCVSTGDWLCSADMYPVAITESRLETRFLLYFMLSQPFVRLMVDESMRVAMPKVNRETLADIRIPLPDPAEQGAIANFLDRELAKNDSLISKAHQAIDRLKELRTAMVSAAVTGGIDVRDDRGWQTAASSQVFEGNA